ncbi:MAG: hypothetical protein EHM61_25325, partial [Acidobacteria bacterium]
MALLIKLPILLPAVCFLVWWYLFARRSSSRTAVFKTAIVFGSAVVAVNEILSLFDALTRLSLTLFWGAAAAGSLFFLLRSVHPRECIRHIITQMRSWSRPRWNETFLAAAVLILVAFSGLTAALSPPNTYDAMVYHLPRIVYWIQHQNLDLYPTHELKQLHMAPGAEFLMLQLHLLFGSDRLLNLLQWGAMAGCLAGIWLIARRLGAGRVGAWLAVLFCISIPQGIIQATCPKSDYVMAFWLVAAICLALEFRDHPSLRNAALMGLSFGL